MAKQAPPIRHVWLTPADFLDDADYRSWDCKLCGAYQNIILILYANKGRMPDDLKLLRKNAQWHGRGFEQVWVTILRKKFQVRGGYVRHKRVSQELRRARKAQQDKRRAGLRSAVTRQQKPNAAVTPLPEGKVRKGKVITPPVVPQDEKIFEMDPAPGESPFGPRPDIAVDAAVAHLDAKWLDLEAEGHKIPKFTPAQIAKLIKDMHGVMEVEKIGANDIVRAWHQYGKRLADPKQETIPWCPWYVRDLLARDAVRQTPRAQGEPHTVEAEIKAIQRKNYAAIEGSSPSPDTTGGKQP